MQVETIVGAEQDDGDIVLVEGGDPLYRCQPLVHAVHQRGAGTGAIEHGVTRVFDQHRRNSARQTLRLAVAENDDRRRDRQPVAERGRGTEPEDQNERRPTCNRTPNAAKPSEFAHCTTPAATPNSDRLTVSMQTNWCRVPLWPTPPKAPRRLPWHVHSPAARRGARLPQCKCRPSRVAWSRRRPPADRKVCSVAWIRRPWVGSA